MLVRRLRDPRPALADLARTTSIGVRPLCTPAGLRGAGTEAVWSAAHLALYPLGVLGEAGSRDGREQADRFTLDDLPPLQRGLLLGDVVAAGTPILLVHGLVDNRSVFTLLRRALHRRGFGQVLTLNDSPFTQDVRSAAERLARLIEKTCEETGYRRVHVVGHSLGGVVARYYVQAHGGDARVHTLCTLGGPHAGTRAAHLMPSRLSRQLRPGSDLLAELAAPRQGVVRASWPSGATSTTSSCPSGRPASTTPTSWRATSCCAGSGTCRCRSTGASSTRSRPCWRTSTRTAPPSPRASARCPPQT